MQFIRNKEKSVFLSRAYLCGNVIQEIIETFGNRKPAVLAVIIVSRKTVVATTLDVQADGIQAQIITVTGIQFARHLYNATTKRQDHIIARRNVSTDAEIICLTLHSRLQ